ncbi:glycine betaine ABC transporter substrate-binding protein [Butyricimonas hominis]|uniref:glycine betaine ABC transporter substrate-binding protein n=1 Tax=Butyricimonas TaxID=574697 RepID=UPI003515A194
MKRYMKYYSLAVIIGLVLPWGCGQKKDTIHIATKPMTEQFILGEMLSLLIEENSDLHVKITKGVGGGTSNIHPAIVKGDFDLYPEYTGTGWLVILKKDTLLPPDELYAELQKEYSREYGLKWVAPYGFNNAYSLAVSNDAAEKYHLKTFSDLARYPDRFIFGAEYDFYEINDGYTDLCAYYDIKFKKNLDMDIGLKYEAIKSGNIDVMNIFTTDGQLSGANLTVLDDDKHFFPSYYCATVVREETLKEHPELEGILEKMKGILTDSEMAGMNHEVDVKHRSEREVAAEFLQKKGLLKQDNHGK